MKREPTNLYSPKAGSLHALPSRGKSPRSPWYFRYDFLLAGRRRYQNLGPDKAVAEERCKQIERELLRYNAGLIDARQVEQALGDRKHVDRHVSAFERHLLSHTKSERSAKQKSMRVREMLRLMQVTRAGQMDVRGLDRAKQSLLESGRYPRTVNHYVQAVKQFARWLKGQGVLAADPIDVGRGVSVKGKIRYRRRAPSSDEVGLLVRYVRTLKGRRGAKEMHPADRAIAYMVAFGTGLRAGEIRSIRAEWVLLDEDLPSIFVPAEHTKSGEPAEIPLVSWLRGELRTWMAARWEKATPSGGLLPNLPKVPANMLRTDLNEARAAYLAEAEDDGEEQKRRAQSAALQFDAPRGRWDFHSFRHGFTTALVSGGASAKVAQEAARHADAKTTFDFYAHVEPREIADAVEKSVRSPLGTLDNRARPPPETPP